MSPRAVAAIVLFLAVFAQSAYSQYFVGSKGGCYRLTKSGNKRYVDRSMCASKPAAATATGGRAAVAPARPAAPPTGSTSKYQQGSRGGCYTITESGGKRYVDRGMCQ
jgi:hypothetical protein